MLTIGVLAKLLREWALMLKATGKMMPGVLQLPASLTLSFQDQNLTLLALSLEKKKQLGIWTLALSGKFTRAVTQEGGALVEKRSERDLNLGKHDIIDPRTTGKSR